MVWNNPSPAYMRETWECTKESWHQRYFLCVQNLSKLAHAVHEKCIDLVAMTVISSLRCDGYDIVKCQEENNNLL